MKQTISLEGSRKAVVEIPYSKLTSTSNAYQRTTQESSCCDGKVVVLGYGGCPSKSKQSNNEINAILADLEISYDKDIKELKEKIQGLQQQREKMKQTHFEEVSKLKYDFNEKITEKQSAAELLRGECKRKDKQIADLLNEKEVLIRSKISEFRQSEYIDRIHELQGIIKVKELQLNDLGLSLQRSNRERLKLEETRVLQHNNWQRQASNLKSKLNQIQLRYIRQIQERSGSLAQKSEEWLRKAKEYQLLIEQSHQQRKALRKQSETQSNQFNKEINLLKQLNQSLQINLQTEKKKVQKLQADQVSVCQDLKQSRQQILVYIDKLQKNEQAFFILDKQKADLLLELEARILEVSELRQQISSQEKVYQVKIQRVIDGQPQIQELRNVVAELEMQLKQFAAEKDILSEELKKRQYTNDELRRVIAKLEAEITGLKAYIEKRQGSFKWAVEREIQKDIVVSDSKNQYYKVSQVKQYNRDKNPSKNYKMAFDRISSGVQQHLAGNFQDQIIFTNGNEPSQTAFVQYNQAPYNNPSQTPFNQPQ